MEENLGGVAMPIYEFKCNNCGKNFEHLQLGPEEKMLNCPHCQSDQIEKRFSSFATPKGGSFCPPRCETGGGCCGSKERKCMQ
jgi:putative FmdB family regulatory protein